MRNLLCFARQSFSLSFSLVGYSIVDVHLFLEALSLSPAVLVISKCPRLPDNFVKLLPRYKRVIAGERTKLAAEQEQQQQE